MPELPEVEGVVRELAPIATGRKIQNVNISDVIKNSKQMGKEAIIKGLTVPHFEQSLAGMQITKLVRRSKYIYFYLERDRETYLLVNHLGMTGAWFVVQSLDDILEEKFRKHVHVQFEMMDGGYLMYADIRRFGEMRLLQSEADHPPLLKMAPEPFEEEARIHFLNRLAQPKYEQKPIKEVLMDGQVLAGCGNIYATEALFRMGMHPNRKVNRISQKRKIELFYTVVEILKESIAAGGSSISDYRNINGEAGTMQERLQMYGKKSCPCCQTNTKVMTIAGRTSVYCPACQH